jgi:hypothetical protein
MKGVQANQYKEENDRFQHGQDALKDITEAEQKLEMKGCGCEV